MERFMRIAGWAGVVVGLTGVLPGILLFRGSMIEFGMLILLLGGLLISSREAVEELRHIRRGIARLIMGVSPSVFPSGSNPGAQRAEGVASHSEHRVASQSEHRAASRSEHREEEGAVR